MNLRRLFKWNKVQKTVASKGQVVTVRRAADSALRRYEKTFKDLARYDRGERISVSR